MNTFRPTKSKHYVALTNSFTTLTYLPPKYKCLTANVVFWQFFHLIFEHLLCVGSPCACLHQWSASVLLKFINSDAKGSFLLVPVCCIIHMVLFLQSFVCSVEVSLNVFFQRYCSPDFLFTHILHSAIFVHHFSPNLNVSSTAEWIGLRFCTDIDVCLQDNCY